MTKSMIDKAPSKSLRALLRLPIWVYRVHLGRLLGDRFLLLQHTGRKSGQVRETVTEVVKHDPATDIYYVVSGWGPKSDWYLNTQKNPLATIRVGARSIQVRVVEIAVAEAADILSHYSERYPLAFRELTQLFLGERLHPGHEAGQRLAERMPMVAFQPVQARPTHL